MYCPFVASVIVLAIATVASAQPKAVLPKLPDEKIVEAWEKAGAEHGCIEWDDSPYRRQRMTARTRPAEKAGEIPAFLISPETKLASLKEPTVPFGLYLRKEVTDAQLKALPTFKNLQYVLAYGQPLTDAAAPDLARQKGLRYIDLGRSKMTGAGMKDLATLPALETLHVDSIKVTNDGLTHLVKIKTLRDLNLDESGVTYDALAELVALKNLETLGLLSVKEAAGKPAGFGDWVTKLPKLLEFRTSTLSDAEMKHFGGIPTLRSLAFDVGSVTNVGLKELTRAKDLETLTLSDAKLTNAGFKELASFGKLRRLVLSGSNITDADLKAFAGMTSLHELIVRGTKVTDSGVADLKKALPKLRIEN
ncbi:MAG: hypothetical protein K8U57_14865 [Planctomycetes bacterium]|nr:hypothetical protein [Planctomycetota bacterium]